MSEDSQKKPNVPVVNATLLGGKNTYLYPFVTMPSKGGPSFPYQNNKNILLLQNYFASQYVVNPQMLGLDLSQSNNSGAVKKAPSSPEKKEEEEKEKKDVVDEKEPLEEKIDQEVVEKPGPEETKEKMKPKVKPLSLPLKKVKKKSQKRKHSKHEQDDSKNGQPSAIRIRFSKKQKLVLSTKTEGDNILKKRLRVPSTPKPPPSPTITPRRKPTNDLLGFVSCSLPVPRDISSEWENYKKEIITPPWQPKPIEVDLDEDSSSEEDISDEKYYFYHKRAFDRDCKRIRDVLSQAPGKKSTKSTTSKDSSTSRKLKQEQDAKPTGLARPIQYNYSFDGMKWCCPEDYISYTGFVPKSKKKKEKEQTLTVPRTKRGRRKKRKVNEDSLSKRYEKGSMDLEMMKLEYLQLQTKLRKLREIQSSSWKAEKKLGKNGKATNIIRLRRVSKFAA